MPRLISTLYRALAAFCAVCFFIDPSYSQDIEIPEECWDTTIPQAAYVIDKSLPWFSINVPKGPDIYDFNADTVELFSKLNDLFVQNNKALTLLLMPAPNFFMPREVIQNTGRDWLDEQSAAQSMIQTLNSAGIETVDLISLLEADGSKDTYQRMTDHHFTGQGVLDTARLLVNQMSLGKGSQIDPIQLNSKANEEQIDAKPYQSIGVIQAALIDSCKDYAFINDIEFSFTSTQTSNTSLADDLFGGSEDKSIVTLGTSYSQMRNGVLPRAIEFYSGRAVVENSITGGKIATALERFIASQGLADPTVGRVIWEAEMRLFGDEQAFGAAIQLLGMASETCTDSLVINTEINGDIASDGWTEISRPFVIEDVLELTLPGFVRGGIDLEFEFFDGSTRTAELLRFAPLPNEAEQEKWRITLPSIAGWQDRSGLETIRFRPQLTGDVAEEVLPTSFGARSCWTKVAW